MSPQHSHSPKLPFVFLWLNRKKESIFCLYKKTKGYFILPVLYVQYWYILFEMIKAMTALLVTLRVKKINFTAVLFRAVLHCYHTKINISKCYNQMYLTSRNGCEIHFFKSLRPKAVVVWLMTQNKEDFSLPFVCEVETKLQWEHSTIFYHDYKGIPDNFDVFKISSVEIITKCYGISVTISCLIRKLTSVLHS